MKTEDIRETYINLQEKNEVLLSDLKRRHLVISMLRLLVFAGGGIFTAIEFTHSAVGGSIVFLVTMFLFLFLVKKHEDYANRITNTQNLIIINRNEIRGLQGDYSAFDGGMGLNDARHDFSNDIDLFGNNSLFSYLNRTVTGSGRSQLARWLCEPYDLREEIIVRQEAVRVLSARLDWRQQFMASGIEKQLSDEEIESIGEWLNEDDNLYSSSKLKTIVYALPITVIIALILAIAGILPLIIFLLLFFVNLFVVGIFLKRTNRIHAMVSKKNQFLSSVMQLIRLFEKEKFNSSFLNGIQGKLYSGQGSAAGKIKELNVIIRSFDSRLNIFVGLILNGLLLWDLHCIIKLGKWRKAAASDLPEWLYLIGTVDGLNSIANYAFNNPDYPFPLMNNDGFIIEALRMGHPLLKRDTRVCNDFSIRKRGLVFIITGANMAGKSTFLRTVAVNMVLAMAGAPVCCEKMKFVPVKLFTSMRTVDSLSRNESYFYAELKRLKILKERLEKGEDVLFILDEILKGTNSTDKSLGSKKFLGLMIELGGTGLVATHDNSLGEMETTFPENVVNKCFEIGIDGEDISFDYLLRDGITRKMNAAALMRQMGIA